MIRYKATAYFDLEKARQAIMEHRAAGVRKLAEYVAEMARVFCPVRTGRLRNSIRVVPGGGGLQWYVIVTEEYAEAVEFGHINVQTGRMVPGVGFLRRALRLGALKYPEFMGGASGVNKGFASGKAVSMSFR